MYRRIVVGSNEDVNNEIRVWDEDGKEYSIKGTRIHMYEYIDRMVSASEGLKKAYRTAYKKFDENSNVLSNIRFLIDESEKIIINRARFEESLEQKFYGYHQAFLSDQERNYFNEFREVDTDLQDLISELKLLISEKNEVPANVFENRINTILYKINAAKDRVVYTDKELSPTLSRTMESSRTMKNMEELQPEYSENDFQRQEQAENVRTYGGKPFEFGATKDFAPFPPTKAKKIDVYVDNEVRKNSEIGDSENKEAINSSSAEVSNQVEGNPSDISFRRRRSRRRRADKYQNDYIQDYEFSISSTEEDIASLMNAFGIAEDSEFYKYIKRRIDFASRIDWEYIEERSKEDPSFISSNIYNYVKEIKERNKDLIEGRYRHYELYRGLDTESPSINDKGAKDVKSFFYKVLGLDISSSVKLGNLLRGIYQKSMTDEQLEELAIDIENDLLRIKKFDEFLEVASDQIIAHGEINSALSLFKEAEEERDKKQKKRVFKGNEKVEKLIKFAKENPGKIAAGIGATILLGGAIAGVSAVSWDDIKVAIDKLLPTYSIDYQNEQTISDEPIQSITPEQFINYIGTNNEAVALGGASSQMQKDETGKSEDTSNSITDNSEENQVTPSIHEESEPKVTIGRNKAEVTNTYCFASAVGNLTQEEIELYGVAIKEGDKNVPDSVYTSDALTYGIGDINNAEELKIAFEKIDNMLAVSRGHINSHALSYQSVELGEAIIKQHISEVYNVPVDKIGFYYNMPKDDTDRVNKVDVLLLDNSGQTKSTLVKYSHMDAKLQEAMKMIGGLKKIRNKIGVFEENETIYRDTSTLYKFLRSVLTDEFEFQKNGKDLNIVEPGSKSEVSKSSDDEIDI